MLDETPSLSDQHSDAAIPMIGCSDEAIFLSEVYSQEEPLTEAEIDELCRREMYRQSTSNVIGVGHCKAIDAIIALFDPKPAA